MNEKDVINNFIKGKRPKPTVCYPKEIENGYVGDLYGYYQSESNYYNIVSVSSNTVAQNDVMYCLGTFLGEVEAAPNCKDYQKYRILGYILNGNVVFVTTDGKICETEK